MGERLELAVVEFAQLGYQEAWELQKRLVAARCEGRTGDTLILLEHPPVLTVGRTGSCRNILVSETLLRQQGVEVYQVERGGDVTYHGPGQIVGYPILDLNRYGRDVHDYYAKLEQVFINLLAEYGLDGYRDPRYPGVWVQDRKIAAIGIAVKHWVTMHGFAFNLNPDLRHFQWINPCGITDKGVTALAELYPGELDAKKVRRQIIDHFAAVFGVKPEMVNFEEMRVMLDA